MLVVSRESLPVTAEDGAYVERGTEMADMTFEISHYPKGTDFTPMLNGLPGDLCTCPHRGYVFKGKIKFRETDGEELVAESGNGFYLAPGHTAEALEDTDLMVLSPTRELKEVMAHVMFANASIARNE